MPVRPVLFEETPRAEIDLDEGFDADFFVGLDEELEDFLEDAEPERPRWLVDAMVPPIGCVMRGVRRG